MHDEGDKLEIVKSNENFITWSLKEFIDDDIRSSIANSSILLVPTLGFRDISNPSFPPYTEEIFSFFKNNVPNGYEVDICIGNTNFAVLSLNSDYKRLGKFVVKKIAVPVFVASLIAYITYRITKEQDSKPQINITNNITNITLPEKAIIKQKPIIEKRSPHKYLEPSKVTFSVTVVDTNGKSLDFHYSGPVKDVESVTEKVKKAFVDEP